MPNISYDQDTIRPRGFSIPFGRRGLILSAMALIGAGLWLNWGRDRRCPPDPCRRPLRRHVRIGSLHDGRLEILRHPKEFGRWSGNCERVILAPPKGAIQ